MALTRRLLLAALPAASAAALLGGPALAQTAAADRRQRAEALAAEVAATRTRLGELRARLQPQVDALLPEVAGWTVAADQRVPNPERRAAFVEAVAGIFALRFYERTGRRARLTIQAFDGTARLFEQSFEFDRRAIADGRIAPTAHTFTDRAGWRFKFSHRGADGVAAGEIAATLQWNDIGEPSDAEHFVEALAQNDADAVATGPDGIAYREAQDRLADLLEAQGELLAELLPDLDGWQRQTDVSRRTSGMVTNALFFLGAPIVEASYRNGSRSLRVAIMAGPGLALDPPRPVPRNQQIDLGAPDLVAHRGSGSLNALLRDRVAILVTGLDEPPELLEDVLLRIDLDVLRAF